MKSSFEYGEFKREWDNLINLIIKDFEFMNLEDVKARKHQSILYNSDLRYIEKEIDLFIEDLSKHLKNKLFKKISKL